MWWLKDNLSSHYKLCEITFKPGQSGMIACAKRLQEQCSEDLYDHLHSQPKHQNIQEDEDVGSNLL